MRLLAAILAGVFLFPVAEIHAAPKPPAQDTPVYDEREALAKLQAMDIFPEMEKEDSGFADALSSEVECLECDEPAFFKSPAWPLRAARKVAARLGVKPRTVAEIRKDVSKSFEVSADAFQQVHGIGIVSARVIVGGEPLDITPQFAARVTEKGFAVDCDWTLVGTLAEESQFERTTDESNAEYWKRQRKLLAAVASPERGAVAVQITFEFHSEQANVVAKEGERLTISEEGVVAISKIVPVTRPVRRAAAVESEAKPASTKPKQRGAVTAGPERPKR